MALRDDLIDIVDEVRDDILVDLTGMRLHTVSTRSRVWSGSEIGRGTPTDTTTELLPRPRVRPPAPRQIAESGGKVLDGDRIIDRISATYDEADLTGGTLAAGTEWAILIDDEPYRVVDKPRAGYLGWSMQVRRMAR